MNKVVAFCGSKGSGKSTSASIFKERLSTPVEEMALAGHLKDVCSRVFGLDLELFLNPKLKEVELEDFVVLDRGHLKGVMNQFSITEYDDTNIRPHIGRIFRTPRQILQYIGTEVLHPIDPLIHVKMAMRKRDVEKATLITDLRFAAEFDYLRLNYPDEFFPVYVKNSSAEVAASVDSHASEREYEQFKTKCTVVNNESSMGDLTCRIDALIESMIQE